MGVLTGCATWVVMIFHIYDSAREWLLAFVLTAVTSGLWLIALISYGATFPHWILSTYYEFGYSFWLLLTSTCVYFIPVVAFIAWRLVLRAQATTEEERHMACPTLLTTASLIFTLASLCTTYWAQSTQGGEGYENHLGLLEGRYNGDWIHFRHLAQIDSHITSAGMSTFILLLCSLLIQTPIAWLGWRYVLGVHEVCKGQMPLLNTAMSAASLLHATHRRCGLRGSDPIRDHARWISPLTLVARADRIGDLDTGELHRIRIPSRTAITR